MRPVLELLASARGGGALLVVVVIALFAQVASFEFTLDSQHFLEVDARVRHFDVGALLTTDYWHREADTGRDLGATDLYRPVPLLWLSALLQLTPDAQLARHTSVSINLGNVLLHALGVVLRFLLLRRLLAAHRHGARWAFAAALLLAVHPVATEAVCTQVGACESWAVLGAFGSLLAFDAWQRTGRKLALAAHAGLLLVGLLAKENAIAVVALTPLYARCALDQTWRRAARATWPAVAAAAVWVALRAAVFGALGGAADPVLAGFAPLARFATALATFASYSLPALVWPTHLLPLVSHQDVPLVGSLLDARALVGLAFWAALALAGLFAWRRERAAAFGLALFALTFLPVSNLLVSIGALAATRFLYLPLTGLALAAAAVLARTERRAGLAALVAGMTCAAAAWCTWREAAIWSSPATLFAAAHARAPSSFHGLNLARALQAQAGEAERRKDGAQAARLRDRAAELFEAAATASRPTIPGSESVPEDLLDSGYLAAMSAALANLTAKPRDERHVQRALAMLEVAAAIADRGMAQRGTAAGPLTSTTVWGNHRSDVDLTRAEHWLNEAARGNGPARERDLERADAALAQARAYWSGNWKVELVGLKALLVRGDQNAYARGLEALYGRARNAMPDDSRATEIGTTFANLLMSRGDRERGTHVMLETALAGRRFVADVSGFFTFGRQGLNSQDPQTRQLAKDALAWFVARADGRLAAQRREAEQLLATAR